MRKLQKLAPLPDPPGYRFSFSFDGRVLFPYVTPDGKAAATEVLDKHLQQHPEDADGWAEFIALHKTAPQEVVLALAARRTQAAEQLTKRSPESRAAWTQLGEALLAAKDFSGAARAFRKALELEKDSARERLLLGSTLGWEALQALLPVELAPRVAELLPNIREAAGKELIDKLAGYQPSQEQIRKAEERLKGARAFLGQDLKTDDPRCFYERYNLRWMIEGWVAATLEALQAGQPKLAPALLIGSKFAFQQMLSEDGRGDLRAAAQRMKGVSQMRLTGFVVYQDVMALAMEMDDGPRPGDPRFWSRLPQEKRALVQVGLKRLGTFTTDSELKLAAEAAEWVASLGWMATGDTAERLRWARLAVELDPKRRTAWTLLIGSLMQGGADDDALKLYTNFASQPGEAGTWLLFAHLHDAHGKTADLQRDVAEALKSDPEGLESILSKTALLLRTGAAGLTEARTYLEKVRKTMETSSQDQQAVASYYALNGITLVLEGKLDEGRTELGRALTLRSEAEGRIQDAQLTRLKEALALLAPPKP